MKRLVLYSFALIMALCPLARAAETDKMALAREMGQAVGLDRMIEQIKQKTDQAVDQQMAQMIAQMRKSLPELPAEYVSEMDKLVKEYVVRIKNSWNAKEAAEVYSKALSDLMSPEALSRAIEHYKTEQGKAELKAVTEAGTALNAYITESYQKISATEMPEFMSKMRNIALKAKQNSQGAKPQGEAGGQKK